MNKDNLYLASNIKWLRIKYHKTQGDIGKICGKKHTAVSNWEKGIREPDCLDLARLANYFDISIDELMLKDLRQSDCDSSKKA